MSDNFSQCLEVLLLEEGGFVSNRMDPGGVTNLGVTKRVWESWRGQPATEADMRALTPAVVAPLYRTRYWQASSCDKYPVAIALMVFDFAVNAGEGRSIITLQRVLGVADDGHAGPKTLMAVQTFIAANGKKKLIELMRDKRIEYYKSLKTFSTFGKGWVNRANDVAEKAMSWAS